MQTISQRELRNESGEVMRAVAQGASYRVTNRGVPVAVLAPITDDPMDALIVRRGTQVMRFAEGVRLSESTASILDELRGDR